MSGNTPWFKTDSVDSNDVEINKAATTFSADSPLPAAVEMEPIAVPSKATFDMEKFMAEKVEVILAEPMSEMEPTFAELQVNGDYVCVPRDGMPHTIKRYHLEVLARAKQSRVRQKKVVNPDGSMGYQEESVLALTYPYQLIRDDNPHGRSWLKSVARNPG